MSQNDEIERLKRLRDRQIGARDPMKKVNQRDRRIATQIREGRRYTWDDALKDLNKGVVLWTIGMAICGLLGGMLFAAVTQASWATYVVYVLVVLGALMGYVIGKLVDKGKGGWTRRY